MNQIMRVDDPSAKSAIVELLEKNEILIMPCDTIYGIIGKVPETLSTLRHIKGREETKPFIQLVTLAMAQKISATEIGDDILSLWPGPLTVIVDSTIDNNSVAIRVPQDALLLSIIEQLDAPIYSSSVNVAGEPSLHNFEAIVTRFGNKVPLCVKKEEEQGTVASTIIDIRKKPYRLLRRGAQDVTSLEVIN